jgi:hypothetical protein
VTATRVGSVSYRGGTIIGSHTTWKGGEPVEEIELWFAQVKSTYLSPDGQHEPSLLDAGLANAC